MSCLRLLVNLCLVSGVVRGDDCTGGVGGNRCGSWFSHMTCLGNCCHDDFNAWCCPPGDEWVCQGTFNHDTSHCKATKSCSCTDNTPYLVRSVATGPPQVASHSEMDFGACCPPKASGCGVGTSFTWTNQQSVTWKASVSLTNSFTLKQSLLVEGLEYTITLTTSYENGQTKSKSEAVQLAHSCKQDLFTEGTYVSQLGHVSVLEVPVKLYYKRCGVQSEVASTVKSHVLDGGFDCNSAPSAQEGSAPAC
eukprot:CAMPEP_0177195208 /NCGR_PEP_ID=MMETSP0367-20130122/23393_1 /TAXON_ID=447022 ORGANISM="Scrippsiella hangoei-like, Strain SHHI-4" /NCGR_SAMPLE_ID=MMETSP0367 /ASSEMBLY_ACC=CAM_ASM_000362 /LENGTH=249 /DNA_ID=CAMNT_0018643225 /DNA_START=63 /DNA_END=812 /DNA_ORIENTATION=-